MLVQSDSDSNAHVLRRLSTHLDMLAGQIFSVEEALSGVLAEDTQTSEIPITKFQSLDFTRQSLEDCALLLHFLSNQILDKDSIHQQSEELSKKLKLDATRNLLCDHSVEKENQKNGEVDFF